MSNVLKSNPRVEILFKTRGDTTRGKRFGYVVGVNTTGGMHLFDQSRASEPGEAAFLVSRSADGKSGAIWYSHQGIRFTKPPQELTELSPDERVGVDLMLQGRRDDVLEKIVPDVERRHVVRSVGTALGTLKRPR